MKSLKHALLALCLASMVAVPGCVDGSDAGEAFPSFTLEDGLTNTTVSKEANLGEAWVAYFSASWCGHCHPTLDAVDQVIPNGSLLVFNKEPAEEYSDMVEWHNNMEEEIGRELNRPFVHAPTLSIEVGVPSIPYVVLVDASGTIVMEHSGLWNDVDSIAAAWNQAQSA